MTGGLLRSIGATPWVTRHCWQSRARTGQLVCQRDELTAVARASLLCMKSTGVAARHIKQQLIICRSSPRPRKVSLHPSCLYPCPQFWVVSKNVHSTPQRPHHRCCGHRGERPPRARRKRAVIVRSKCTHVLNGVLQATSRRRHRDSTIPACHRLSLMLRSPHPPQAQASKTGRNPPPHLRQPATQDSAGSGFAPHCIELHQAAGLEAARHKQDVGAGENSPCQSL
jgi:hypothetical protein